MVRIEADLGSSTESVLDVSRTLLGPQKPGGGPTVLASPISASPVVLNLIAFLVK
jgi:hypothetical protein